MSKLNKKMQIIKKIFIVLLILDLVNLILSGINLIPDFKELAEYGTIMLGITIAISAVAMAVMLFEILAKVFFIRSTSPDFSWASGRRGYKTVAKIIMVFSLAAVLINIFSLGGEGATFVNQARIYLQILVSLVEFIVLICYLGTAKKLSAEAKENSVEK